MTVRERQSGFHEREAEEQRLGVTELAAIDDNGNE